jgi:hypothetical protein
MLIGLYTLPPCTCSEAVQTIDCNQDGFLVEALKLPNLLAEFELQDGRRINVRGSLAQQQQLYAGWWAKLTGAGTPQGPALLGFREWVFSEDSGALAEFAAATERSFGTTMQRVMHNPGEWMSQFRAMVTVVAESKAQASGLVVAIECQSCTHCTQCPLRCIAYTV